jgi:hypothetical protein
MDSRFRLVNWAKDLVARKESRPHQAAAGGASPDRISQLERLNELKKSGALTKDEFQREKAKLLG